MVIVKENGAVHKNKKRRPKVALVGQFPGSFCRLGDGFFKKRLQSVFGHQDFKGGLRGAAGAADVFSQPVRRVC